MKQTRKQKMTSLKIGITNLNLVYPEDTNIGDTLNKISDKVKAAFSGIPHNFPMSLLIYVDIENGDNGQFTHYQSVKTGDNNLEVRGPDIRGNINFNDFTGHINISNKTTCFGKWLIKLIEIIVGYNGRQPDIIGCLCAV